MMPDEANRVHINNALRDDEIEAMAMVAGAAVPGEWLTTPPAVEPPRIRRRDGTTVDDRASMVFMARARAFVPRLITAVRALEGALRSAWAEIASLKAERLREREEHELALNRARGGEPGPKDGLKWLVVGARYGVIDELYGALLVERWSRGEDISTDTLRAVCYAEVKAREALEAGSEEAGVELGKLNVAQLAQRYRVMADDAALEKARAYVREHVVSPARPGKKKSRSESPEELRNTLGEARAFIVSILRALTIEERTRANDVLAHADHAMGNPP